MDHPFNKAVAIEDVRKVMEYAASLGLHGVLILSPVCASCGVLHQWSMMTDMMTVDGGDEMVRDLLAWNLDRMASQDPVDLGPARGLDG